MLYFTYACKFLAFMIQRRCHIIQTRLETKYIYLHLLIWQILLSKKTLQIRYSQGEVFESKCLSTQSPEWKAEWNELPVAGWSPDVLSHFRPFAEVLLSMLATWQWVLLYFCNSLHSACVGRLRGHVFSHSIWPSIHHSYPSYLLGTLLYHFCNFNNPLFPSTI